MNNIEKAIEKLQAIKDFAKRDMYKNSVYVYPQIAQEEINACDLAISALEQQLTNGWIPVSERLPNQEESIKYRAVFLIQDKYIDLPYMAIWNRIKNIWVDEDGDRINSVTAWQPLPEPWKEVSELEEVFNRR